MKYIIHIGKCGGGSLWEELKKINKKIKRCHCKRPEIKREFNYIILIRDPINRFISAFNWKKFISSTNKIKIEETNGYKYWKTINNLSENLYDKNGNINKTVLKLIKVSNHLHLDINYYLEKILPFLNKNNCNVIRFEHYNDDINNIFNIKIKSQKHVYNKKDYSKYISDKGIKNLKRFLEKDYNCFHKLKEKNIINDEYYHNILSGKFYLDNVTKK